MVSFPARRARAGGKRLTVLRGVDLSLHRGRSLALVGESGCGKSTLVRALLGLIAPDCGRVLWRGRDLAALTRQERRVVRCEMGVVFQDPGCSLDPTLPVWRSVAEPLRAHRRTLAAPMSGRARERRAIALLARVGLDETLAARRPQALSGGERQRAALARAVATLPALLVADEPLSALDASFQGVVLGLLHEMQCSLSLSLLLVSHDLVLVEGIADDVAVMYAGAVVERGPCAAVLESPLHPYTQALMGARLVPDPRRRMALARAPGEPPDFARLPQGCAYHPRCPRATADCRREPPVYRDGAREALCRHVSLDPLERS